MKDKIEQAIHQNHFEVSHQKILIGLMLVNHRLEERQSTLLKQFNLSLQQYNVLRILRGQYPNSCKLHIIRDRMIDRMSDVSRIVERLRKNGFLTRVTKEMDRRAVDILITEKGLALLKSIDEEVDFFYEPIKQLATDDAAALTVLLDKLLDQILTLENISLTE